MYSLKRLRNSFGYKWFWVAVLVFFAIQMTLILTRTALGAHGPPPFILSYVVPALVAAAIVRLIDHNLFRSFVLEEQRKRDEIAEAKLQLVRHQLRDEMAKSTVQQVREEMDEASRRRLAQAQQLRCENRTRFSLYLHSFGVEGNQPITASESEEEKSFKWAPFISLTPEETNPDLETTIAEILRDSTPLIAIGNPIRYFGAGRIRSGKEWFDVFKDLAPCAEAIYLVPFEKPHVENEKPGTPNKKSGLAQEVEFINKNGLQAKTTFIMPPGARKGFIAGWNLARTNFAKEGIDIPEYSSRGALFWIDSSGKLWQYEHWKETFAATLDLARERRIECPRGRIVPDADVPRVTNVRQAIMSSTIFFGVIFLVSTAMTVRILTGDGFISESAWLLVLMVALSIGSLFGLIVTPICMVNDYQKDIALCKPGATANERGVD